MAENRIRNRVTESWRAFLDSVADATDEELECFRKEISEPEFFASGKNIYSRTLASFALSGGASSDKLYAGLERFVNTYGPRVRDKKTLVDGVPIALLHKLRNLANAIFMDRAVIASPDDVERIAAAHKIEDVKRFLTVLKKNSRSIEWNTDSGEMVEDFYASIRSGRAPSYETKRAHYFGSISTATRGVIDLGTIPFYVPRKTAGSVRWYRMTRGAWIEATSEAKGRFADALTRTADDTYDRLMGKVIPELDSEPIGTLLKRPFSVYCMVAHVPDLIELKAKQPSATISSMQLYVGEAKECTLERWAGKAQSSHQKAVERVLAPAAIQPDAILAEILLAYMWTKNGNWDGVAIFVVKIDPNETAMHLSQGVVIDAMRARDMNFGLNNKAGMKQ